jgi:hypothetical protein
MYPLVRMSAPCYFCNKKVSYPCKNKHLFSALHTKDIEGALQARKASFLRWVNDTEKNYKQPTPSILIKNIPYKICLVCNKICAESKGYMNCPCGKTKENAEAIKAILGDADALPETDVNSTCSDPKLQEEIEKLQNENNLLKKQLKDKEKLISALRLGIEDKEEAAESDDVLQVLLEQLKEPHQDAFSFAKSLIKRTNKKVYKRMNDAIDDDWDNEREFE